MKSLLRRIFGVEIAPSPWSNDALIRDELFSAERLEQHAASLAKAQDVTLRPIVRRSLHSRLRENGSVLLHAYRDIGAAMADGQPITPAAEWLIDNYHLVEEQLFQIHDDLPRRFYRQLPKLAGGPLVGYPRVLGIAWASVAHSDSRFDPEALRRFVRAYQQVTPLTIGELWAVAITLRVVLIENLRRAAERIVSSRLARAAADRVADQILGINGLVADPDALIRHHDADDLFSPAFVVQVVKRLRDQDPRVTPALLWLENQLAAQGTTADEIVHSEHQRQGASNVTVRNIITSMRLISDVNWQDFFEAVSLVDAALRSADTLPCAFASMDFPTRNLYRSAIEELARGSTHTELEITHAAIEIARGIDCESSREHDPGYHLFAGGRRAFERRVGFRPPLRHSLVRSNAALGPSGYIGAILLLAIAVLAVPLLILRSWGIVDAQLLLLAVLGLVPAIDVAVALVNRAAAKGFGPTLMPALELRDGVPERLRTLVVTPILLTTADDIETQIERLEVHFLASSHGALHFALLSDWPDAAAESIEGDAELLQLAAEGIARLNRTHGRDGQHARFLLLHRRRLRNEGQRRWMGWERKRGKLHELNRLLRGDAETTFIAIEGKPPLVPPDVRYVITLDADTRLPRETVRRLIGKLAHPLNQPRFDKVTRRVIDGYAILQPRVTPSLPIGREGSLFQRVFSGMNGIDPYDAATSDVYQDLFGVGSYAGKGIYDVDAFEAALAGRVPDNSLLSHDLFEGTFARAALASDIEVIEEFPSRYDVAAARNHRWTRGDWQLLPWILGRGGVLPSIGFWKMFDNLRRTLSAPACVAALIAGWLLPFDAALAWTAFVFATIAVPPLLPVLGAIVPHRRRVSARSHLRALLSDFLFAVLQIEFLVAFLAHQAWLMMDAILRTLYRLIVSRRNLLEWVTAAQAQLDSRLDWTVIYRRMFGSVIIAIAAACGTIWLGAGAWPIAVPFVMLWIAAPAIARWISVSPLIAGHLPMSDHDALALRLVARRTWRFFETFVTQDDHMLPPDNFQEDPEPVVAHRTSPTNMGLYLLCVLSARDFGWLGTAEAVARLEATLATMLQLRRFHGHFYNWYDTRDLRPLEPKYVSSVDSGNLAAHLIAVASTCREWRAPISPAVTSAVFAAGVRDSLHFAREALRILPEDRRSPTVMHRQLEAELNAIGSWVDANELAVRPDAVTFAALASHADIFVDSVRALTNEGGDIHQDLVFWADATRRSIEYWRREATQSDAERHALTQRLAALEGESRALALAMEFDFLLDSDRKLLAIGYRATDGTLDSSCYDLLASEARLASFFAIAKNDAPTRHWFRLGRTVTSIGHGAALVSWSGSMFEYLMPSLVMRAPAGSLLEQTSCLIVSRQIQYGKSLGLPWGVSESAYSARDIEFTYQYSNFGVPGLGLKRGLSENVVIAPYATGLAAMVDPEAAARNFEALASVGAYGRFGFYEALDYTRSRLPDGERVAIVRAFMAHHQGMTIVAIANVLFDGRMRARFHAESSIQATELLLQERTPRDVVIAHPRAEEVATAPRIGDADLPKIRRLQSPHDATPQTHLLSNGRYAVMVTSAGSGYSRWREQSITRWREDTTRDDAGSYIFLREVEHGAVWSAAYQPSGVEPDRYEVTFTEGRADFVRVDGEIVTSLQIVVSPEDDAEVRRVSIANTGDRSIDIDVTSYCELVLAPAAADVAHQAFSKLFVQTEYIAKGNTLLATRRRRSPEDPEIWAAHHAIVEGETLHKPEFESDRARFLGRGREIHEPIAVLDGRPLSNTAGTVLDPIFALRHRLRIPPRTSASISFWTCIAASRTAVVDMVDKQQDANAFARASTLAWTQAQVQLRHLGMLQEEATLFQRLAGHVLYADASMRPPADAIRRGSGPREALWAHGISGDLPIVLLRIDHLEDIAIARELLQAHEYWRLKQVAVDVVILNERASSYVQDLQIALDTLVRMSQSRPPLIADSAKGSVFVLRTDLIATETRTVLSSVARVVLVAQRGSIQEQLERRIAQSTAAGVRPRRWRTTAQTRDPLPTDLEFFNGLGGFAADGREYETRLDAEQSTPAPWINVIANPQFGFQCAVEGGGYTWSVNSRENQLTQWSNDPVVDRPGEALYVRDEDTGALWGPTAAPVRDASDQYRTRHGQGWSRFEHTAHDIALELTVYVPLNDPIKICRLTVRNMSQRKRRLSVTAYAEWVLGTTRALSAPYVATEMDDDTNAMFARNPWNAAFAARVAFADLGGRQTQWTGDRREFLGRHGRLNEPAALMSSMPLSKRTGAGLDPCCALQTLLTLMAGESEEIVFFLGEAESAEEAQSLIKRYRSADLDAVLHAVTSYWDGVLGTVQVKTPDRSLDILLNRWLLYQSLACRTWARSAFYQASGAYGFRDQLQDGMALVIAQPDIAREHLLRAAGRQFVEGDVQHWWLPPTGVGVRTRIADDRIWLAYAAAHYLNTTGDLGILDQVIPFLEGAKLAPGDHDLYFEPTIADERATFFEHCARGLDASLAVGAHGLPLIGTGDWNDGMNRVGEGGHGESVWLGWFLYTTLVAFAAVASSRGELLRSTKWLAHAAALRASIEREAWDGEWYRRGYFDDGTPLGSATNDECRIDSIAQSWSVLSAAADPLRAAQAMSALDAQLIRHNDKLAVLFAPAFDRTPLDPGYVKGYPPGIRENGGQYTHAAAWAVIAFAQLGQGNKAAELFSLLNPINRTGTRTDLRRYKAEPYVAAADVYSAPPHVGRGGWTWYTGSAAWLYRAGLESILGFCKQGDHLLLTPCIPKEWPLFEIHFRHRSSRYDIVVENPNGVSGGVVSATVDGEVLPPGATRFTLLDDGGVHHVRVTLGRPS